MGCLQSKDKPKFITEVPRIDIKPVAYGEVIQNEALAEPQRALSPDNTNNNTKNRQDKYKTKCDSRIAAKYELKALIGKGTFSRVIRVEHRVTRQPYAMKVIECKKGREMFEAELSILKRVRHPNVIQLIEVLETPEKIYLVMELATGGDLFDRIVARGWFTERDAVRILVMVLDGVRYLHALGITHRDLKPDNLLYYHPGNDSRLMITDFGLSCTRSSAGDSYMRTACGTPEYIAPEVVARKPYTNAVDMWAVGVIAYILLCGAFPFDDENPTRLYKQILRAKYSFTSESWMDASPLAKDFISQLLVVNPNERLTASEAIRHPWLTGTINSDKRQLHSENSTSTTQSSQSSSTSQSVRSSQSSTRSRRSLRSEHRRVRLQDLDSLQMDPEVSRLHHQLFTM